MFYPKMVQSGYEMGTEEVPSSSHISKERDTLRTILMELPYRF